MRTIKSTVTQEVYERAWEEFPEAWFANMDIATQVIFAGTDQA